MLWTLAAAVTLAVVHLSWRWLPSLRSVPRSAVLSAGSGVSIAYVFLHLLPEVAATQDRVADAVGGGPLELVESHAWLVALVGLGVVYALEVLARRSRGGRTSSGERRTAAREIGWISIAIFTLYNAVVGLLLHEELASGLGGLWLFTLALAVHFAVNDHGLREHHGELYDHLGRWLVSGGVLIGWVVGAADVVPHLAVGALIAFLSGGIVMNTLKEELPEDRQARVGPFVAGALVYGTLLLAL